MLQDVKDLTAPGVIKGLNTQYNFLTLSKDQSPNMMDVKVNYDGSFEKRLGSHIQNGVVIATSGVEGFIPDSASLLIPLLTSYWNMDEASGTRSDRIGAYSLSDSGGVLFASGIKNQAALFSASCSQFLYANNPSLLTGNTSFSISASVYLASTSTTLQRTIASKWFSKTIGGSTILPSAMVSNSSPTPYVASASTEFGANLAWKAFDQDDGSGLEMYPVAAPQWLKIDLGSAKIIADYKVLGNSVQSSGPTAWTLEGSATGSFGGEQTTVDTRTGQNTKASKLSYTCSSPGSFQFYRINVSAYDGANDLWINSLELYEQAASTSSYEYRLYIDSDNKAVFDVSSSGTVANGSVRANSYGALLVGSWYNIVANYANNSSIGISVNLSQNNSAYTAGIISTTASFAIGAVLNNVTGSFMDGRIDEVGYWRKSLSNQNRSDLYNLGSGNTYGSSFSGYPWASFDFGASSIRWLTVAAGTGVYASSNLGISWVNIGTSQSATYQYFDRSKNVLIKTSDAYDAPLYWAGSAGTYLAEIGNSAPLCKYSANFQGFLILLNSSTRKRSFNYIDENFQLSSTAWLNFDLPSSADDEITAVFILRRYLYVSTRYKIYRVSYVGGNPDWQYVEVKSWGFIPRTAKKVVIMNNQQGQTSTYSIGEVVVGLTYDRKLRIFDGSGDQLLSSNVEKDNGMCEFALDKITYFGSGPVISFAELDPIPNVYRLCVAIGQDSQQTTHFLNYDGRSQALYPYANMNFNCMTVAESANRQYLMAFDRVGYCHMIDSGNLDGDTTPINDYFESPLMFDKTPSQSSKGHKTDLFFSGTTSGRVYYQDRTDFSNTWKNRRDFVLSGSNNKLVDYVDIDVPETYNTYQFRISSSSGTSNPWRLQRYDHFTKGLGIGKNY